jgi:hypothetical protein
VPPAPSLQAPATYANASATAAAVPPPSPPWAATRFAGAELLLLLLLLLHRSGEEASPHVSRRSRTATSNRPANAGSPVAPGAAPRPSSAQPSSTNRSRRSRSQHASAPAPSSAMELTGNSGHALASTLGGSCGAVPGDVPATSAPTLEFILASPFGAVENVAPSFEFITSRRKMAAAAEYVDPVDRFLFALARDGRRRAVPRA